MLNGDAHAVGIPTREIEEKRDQLNDPQGLYVLNMTISGSTFRSLLLLRWSISVSASFRPFVDGLYRAEENSLSLRAYFLSR